jgi:hypothetical protein
VRMAATFTGDAPACESTACGMTRDDPNGKPWFYPPGQRVACLWVHTGPGLGGHRPVGRWGVTVMRGWARHLFELALIIFALVLAGVVADPARKR